MKNESDFSLTNPELRALTTALKERCTSPGRGHTLWAAEEDLLSERFGWPRAAWRKGVTLGIVGNGSKWTRNTNVIASLMLESWTGKAMKGGPVRNLRGKCRKCRNEGATEVMVSSMCPCKSYGCAPAEGYMCGERALAFYMCLAEAYALHMGRGDIIRLSRLINYLNY